MLTHQLEQRIEQRIGDQVAMLKHVWHGREIPNAADFFWETARRGKPKVWGSSAPAKYRQPLLPQLLLTPHLLVDMYDDEEEAFAQRYGVTLKQMHQLCEEEFVIPFIYLRKNEAWRSYARVPSLAAIIERFGVPHTDLIEYYLNTKYRFHNVQANAEDFFRSVNVPESEQSAIIAAAHGSLKADEWDKVPGYFGQRLAYLTVLGSAEAQKTVNRIKDDYCSPATRCTALSILNGAKALIASPVTAAFEGRLSIAFEQSIDITTALAAATSTARDLSGAIGHAEVDYAETLLERSQYLSQPAGPAISWPMEEPDFASFMTVLRQARDGSIGNYVLSLRGALLKARCGDRASLRIYLDAEREYDSKLRTFGGLQRICNSVGFNAIEYSERLPEAAETVRMWCITVGCTALGLASALAVRDWGRLFARNTERVVCGNWQKAKSLLRIDPQRTKTFYWD